MQTLGAAFLKEVPEGFYDAVIVDSSDPVGEFWLQYTSLEVYSTKYTEIFCFDMFSNTS